MNETTQISLQRPPSSEVQNFKYKQLRCFYEPLILLKALTEISRVQESLRTPDRRPTPQTEEELFCRFLDKLANVCDREKGGKTVTALTVIEAENAYIYVFGCNQVNEAGLRDTAEFVAAILTKIAEASQLKSAKKIEAIRNDILRLLIRFNRPRIEKYINLLQGNVDTCIKSCTGLDYEDIPAVERSLEGLHNAIQNLVLERANDRQYLDSCLSCLTKIRSFKKATTTNWFIEQRADEGRLHDDSMACWSELRHHLSRLIFYEDAVATFIETGDKWSELFQEFEIWPIVSSTPICNPLRKQSEKASNIIGRMSSDPDRLAYFRKLAEGLQKEPYDLDGRIERKCQSLLFKPIVHCEILVLDWIIRKSYHLNFFQDFKYIGTSKGACKLCDSYFRAHPSSIKARPTHGNVYVSWAFPDVFKTDGRAALGKRQRILNLMKESIRNDAILVLENKSSTGKRHDSSTNALMSHLQLNSDDETGGSDTSSIEELTSDMNSLDSQLRSETSTLSGSDGEDGGVSLN